MDAEQTQCCVCGDKAPYFNEIYDHAEIFRKDGKKCTRMIFLCDKHQKEFAAKVKDQLIRMKWREKEAKE